MKRYQKSMLHGPLFPNIITYSIPIILTSILQLLFNAADLVVVGRFCGSVSVAAVGATGAITSLIVNLFIGLSVGAGVSTAHAIGGKNDEETHRTIHTALPTALVGGAVLSILGIAFSETFLRWMGTPENVLPLSAVYMRIFFGGMIFNMVYNFSAAILRAAGDTKSPLIFLTIAGVANVALNVIFVTVFDMNVAGVALATTASQAISAVLAVIALMRRTDACRLQIRKLRFYKKQFRKIVSLGLPAGIQSSMFAISNVAIQSSINSFGDVFMSGNASASNLEGFVLVSMDAFNQAALNFTGQNVGAGQYKRVRKILLTCLACTAVVGLVGGLTVFAFGRQLLAIYITDSPQAIEYGILHLSYVCAPYFVLGMTNVMGGALRGLGVSVPPMIISVLGICGVRIAWIYTIFQMPQYHTPGCLFFSYPLSWVITLAAQVVLFVVVYRKRMAMYKE
ncbi:MAG: MATE family efflux transporter [Ruminococcaceae bacterium]|nr:MATE family efflux transporter [Oscillospiraceae bacterium]